MREKPAVKVLGPDYLEMNPGGLYQLGLGNNVEERVVKLHLLQHFCQLMIEDICQTAENNVVFGKNVELVATGLYKEYDWAIEKGFDVFSYIDYYRREKLERYASRPIVNQYCNATKEESETFLPDGWWWNFPGFATKMFEDHFFVAGCVDGPRISRIDPKDPEALEAILEGDAERKTTHSWYAGEIQSTTVLNLVGEEVYMELLQVMDYLVEYDKVC